MGVPTDGQQSVTLKFQLTQAEFVRGVRRGYRRSPFTYVLVPISVAAVLLYAAHLHSQGSSSWLVPTVIGIAWWPFFYFVLPGVTFSGKATAGELRTTTFSATGSHHQGQTYTFDRSWTVYRSCFEFPDMYVLCYALGNSTTIPRRSFATPQDEASFRAILQSHVRCHFRKAD
jgi:hypothetical protein